LFATREEEEIAQFQVDEYRKKLEFNSTLKFESQKTELSLELSRITEDLSNDQIILTKDKKHEEVTKEKEAKGLTID
jgi:hypothetical protein